MLTPVNIFRACVNILRLFHTLYFHKSENVDKDLENVDTCQHFQNFRILQNYFHNREEVDTALKDVDTRQRSGALCKYFREYLKSAQDVDTGQHFVSLCQHLKK